jgi:Flp pilus assembly pilin Flp
LARRTAADQRGATAIEYALIAAGIGAVVAATVYSVGMTTASLAPAFSNWF